MKQFIFLFLLFAAVQSHAQMSAVTRDSLESKVVKDTTVQLYRTTKGSQYIILWSEKSQKYYKSWVPMNKSKR